MDIGKIIIKEVKMMFYDTHAHINSPQFKDNLEEIIKEANDNLVTYINVIGFSPLTNKLANEIALSHKNIYASCGLHPENIDEFAEKELIELEMYFSCSR